MEKKYDEVDIAVTILLCNAFLYAVLAAILIIM